MKRITLMVLLALSMPVVAGTMYEWRDPVTGRLQLGNRPPSNGVKYWVEGQPRPEEIAEQKRQEAEVKAAQERREAELKAAKEQQKAEQEKREAELRAEHIKENSKKTAELERKIQEWDKQSAKECPGGILDIKIGMSKRLFEFCMDMAPDHINTTETAGGVREQWVYPTFPGGSIIAKYYYFTNGILTAIQRQ